MRKWINKKIKEIQNREKGFPHINFFGNPIGWEARGKVTAEFLGKGKYTVISHNFCHTTVHIGREDGTFFRYCPKCLIKTVETEKITNN